MIIMMIKLGIDQPLRPSVGNYVRENIYKFMQPCRRNIVLGLMARIPRELFATRCTWYNKGLN